MYLKISPNSPSPIFTREIGLEIFSPISPVLFRFGPISPSTEHFDFWGRILALT
ncbi:Uncharacterized protein APZ42_009017 [Daphnia magna]|uniref:Uncharacterized protein n=1 Tax=Daphnia magna TaxID=35525 RepID=A0A164E9K5_9CRUS|nr:Uncharacterized protein APZ42_009017 [Daphnia magna]